MSGTALAVIVAAVVLLILILRSRGEVNLANGAEPEKATEQDVRGLLMAGRKIEAIKVYRQLHRVDLKTAKDAVDKMADELPPAPRG